MMELVQYLTLSKEDLFKLAENNKPLLKLLKKTYSKGYEVSIDNSIDLEWDIEVEHVYNGNQGEYFALEDELYDEDDYDGEPDERHRFRIHTLSKDFIDCLGEDYNWDNIKLSNGYLVFVLEWEELESYVITILDYKKLNSGYVMTYCASGY